MGADDWRYEYLSDEIREYKKRVEEAETLLKRTRSEMDACQWQYDKAATILEMLEVAYKVNVTNRSKADTSCAQTVNKEEKK